MSHLLKWLFFTVAFGLLPFGFASLFGYLHDPAGGAVRPSPELLFFALIVCVSVAGDLHGSVPAEGWKSTALNVAFGGFLLSAAVSASLYGAWLEHLYNSPAREYAVDCAVFTIRHPLHPEIVNAVRGADATLELRCSRWSGIVARLFTLSTWVAAFTGGAGFLSQWLRPGKVT